MSQLLIPSSCPKCGSTNREKLNKSRRIDCTGVKIMGEEYDYVTISYTRCRDCGQVYTVRQPGRQGKKTEK